MTPYRVILRVTSGTETFCLMGGDGTPTLDEFEATIFESIDEARIFRDECEAHFKDSLTIFTMECCFIEQYCDTLGWSAGMTILQQEQHIDNLATI